MDWIQRENKHRNLPDQIEVDVESRDPGVLLDLQRALGDLPEKERQVLEVIYLQGHSYESAAELLAIPLGTLKRRLTQARKEIRKKMGNKGASS
jgi:RNA polymerase sigma-70 factor (ECF subfamily)